MTDAEIAQRRQAAARAAETAVHEALLAADVWRIERAVKAMEDVLTASDANWRWLILAERQGHLAKTIDATV